VVRNTLKSLKDTILKDFQQLFGEIITYRVSDSAIYIRHEDIDCEILLMPLEYEEDQRRLLSAQLTGIYFNEFSEVNPDFISPALGRCGRYPSQKRGVPTWNGIIMDSNPGTEDSPWFAKLHNLPATWEYFEQPSPLTEYKDSEGYTRYDENPDAENIENLPPNPANRQKGLGLPTSYQYYNDLIEGATPEWIKRYVLGRWGRSLSGQPVYKGRFSEEFHVSDGYLPMNFDNPIIIGMDFARVPTAVFMQVNNVGQLIVKREAYGIGTGVALFVESTLMPLLQEEWCVGRPLYIVGDPSGVVRDRNDIDDFDYLRSKGFEAIKAPTNLIEPRIASLDRWFLKSFAGQPGILIERAGCPKFVEALNDKYRYKKRRDGTFEDKPDKKNRPWCDIVDGAQYGALGTERGLMGQVMRRLTKRREPDPPPPSGGWS
tara:strand:+ start:596 stop:1888 length:1293 start_codon:yes stop_codon:yes gene_type:complete